MNCRFGTKREPPYEIPAGATDTLDCTLEVTGSGDFGGQLHVFANDVGLREIVLKIHGQTANTETESNSEPRP